LRNTANTSSAVMLNSGSASSGCDSAIIHCALRIVASDIVAACLLNHSAAIAPKVLPESKSLRALAALRSADGSRPSRIMARALPHSTRASARLTLGYTPNANRLGLPAWRYCIRQYFAPVGITSRYSAAASVSLYGLAFGLALRAAVSVSMAAAPVMAYSARR
jgi:hypothetical protein